MFSDDPEIPILHRAGLFSVDTSHAECTQVQVQRQQQQKQQQLSEPQDNAAASAPSPRVLKKRLETFLQVLAAVTGPKQLYCHQLLYIYYHEIAAKPDGALATLAVQCILSYKSHALLPYKDNLIRLLDDKTIRDELVNFNPALRSVTSSTGATGAGSGGGGGVGVGGVDGTEGGAEDEDGGGTRIQSIHREELVPLLVKVLYGRFASKARSSRAARDQSIAR